MLQSLSNTVKDLQAVRLPTLLKRDTRTGVSELVACRSFTKLVFLDNSPNAKENTYVGSLFLNKVFK